MSPRYNSSKSSLFLFELILAILFFAVASAVCIQLFAKAQALSRKSVDTNMAVSISQSAAEAFKAGGGSVDRAAELFSTRAQDDSFIVYYDHGWQPMPPGEEGVYRLKARASAAAIATIEIEVARLSQGGTPLYSLTAKAYPG